jgi:uncharacterized protein (DUF2236 family)
MVDETRLRTSGGILESLARALVRAVPERPMDDGLFGPRSMVWRVHRDRSQPIAGIRALMLQALHPLAMAGVAEHSDWRRDPLGRLEATSGYVYTVTYGERSAALAAAARVRAVHTHVHGVDPATGLAYSAEDPALLLWVHAAIVDSSLDVIERYGRRLHPDEQDRYVAEMVPFAEVVGVPAAQVPATVAELNGYIESVELRQATAAAREAIGYLLDPPFLSDEQADDDERETWRDLSQVAIGTLAEWARAMYGFAQPPPEVLEREAVRQLLGALELGFEAQPGVVEARQRLELRMRG